MPDYHERAQVLLFELRRPADAETVIRDGLAQHPDDAGLHSLLSHSLRHQGRAREAVKAAEAAIGLAPDATYSHEALGWALFAYHRYRLAIEAFRQALEINPEVANFHSALANALLARGFAPDAVEVAEAGLGIDPKHVGCMNCRAVGLAAIGFPRKAVEQLQEALAVDPLEPCTHANLGWVWLQRLRPLRAARAYLESLRLNPAGGLSQNSLQHSVTQISHGIGWPGFALFAGCVALLAHWSSEHFNSVVIDNIAGVAVLMLLPLGILMSRRRFRETLVLLPFRLGCSLHAPADRWYVFAIICGWIMSGSVCVLVGLTSPEQLKPNIVEILPYIASFTFPLAPLVMWLDWRKNAPLEAAIGAGGWALVQIGMIIASYVFALASGAALLLGASLIIALGSLGIIVVGNQSDG